MLQMTLERVSSSETFSSPVVICNAQHCFVVDEQIRELGIDDHIVITEPVGRNTAPAAAVAALSAEPDDILVLLPSDHDIGNTPRFLGAIESAVASARDGRLVTFGIVPTRPETGFGYIRRGNLIADGVHAVAAFVEKPSAEVAEGYVAAGDYYWNAGIFAFRASVLLAELERWAPDILDKSRRALLAARRENGRFVHLAEAPFQEIAGNSIDYAVMEKTAKAAVVPADMDWSDLGSWEALWERGIQDDRGNVLVGDSLAEDCDGCYLRGEHGVVAGLGLRDLVVVGTADAILVADKSRSQEVRKITARLDARKPDRSAIDTFKIHRPWGWFQTIEAGDRFKVKHIMVKPGCTLSLQKHYHRSEHWIVVSGVARATCGDAVVTLNENQSTYIPVGQTHRLENPGKIPLNMIEVQSGEYVGEDDIVRLEDAYGRVRTQT